MGERRLFLMILVVIAALLMNGWFTYCNIRQLYSEAGWVNRTYQVIETAQSIPWLLTEVESAQRGYLLTGEPRYLNIHKSAIPAITVQLNDLSRLTADPDQQDRIPVLRESINKRLKILHENLNLRTQRGLRKSQKNALSRGKAEMDVVRAQINEFLDKERQLLEIRSQRSTHAFNAALMSGVLTNLACFIAFLGFIVVMRRHLLFQTRAAEILHQQREQFRITLSSMGDGVLTTDTLGRVVYLNSIAMSLTGWSDQDAYGKPLEKVFNVIHEQTRQPVENPVTNVLNQGIIIVAINTILISRDGSERPIEYSAAPIKDQAGEIKGIVFIFKDVTGLRKAQEGTRQSALH